LDVPFVDHDNIGTLGEKLKNHLSKIMFFMSFLIANRKRFLNFVAENKQANKSKKQQNND
jgi:hypothetical protein